MGRPPKTAEPAAPTSSTPWKDEVIRIRAILGLEEEGTDTADAVDTLRLRYAEEVTDHAKTDGLRAASERALGEANTAREIAKGRADTLAAAVEKAVADLYARRQRPDTPAQAYADMTAVADVLSRALQS